MHISIAVLTIAGAVTLGAMSPGPSFIMVARTALVASRADGVAAAFGMGTGAVLFAAIALFGLQAILASVPSLHVAIKFLGGAYLLYLGYIIWRGAGQPLVLPPTGAHRRRALVRSYLIGLATQISNPKTAIVYASIFVSLLPPELPVALMVGLPALVFAIETGWYAIVALSLSSALPRATYLRSKSKLDRLAGGIMTALGIKLLAGTREL